MRNLWAHSSRPVVDSRTRNGDPARMRVPLRIRPECITLMHHYASLNDAVTAETGTTGNNRPMGKKSGEP